MDVRLTRITRWMLAALLVVGAEPQCPACAQPPSAELAAILGKWQAAVSEPDQFEIRGERIICNDVFDVQKVATITICYRSPDTVRLEIQPHPLAKGAVTKRRSVRTGAPYRIESDSPSLWIWKSHEVICYSPGTGRRIPEDIIIPARHETTADSRKWPPQPALPEDPLPWWQDWLVRAGEFYLASARQALLPSPNESSHGTGWGLFGSLIYPELQLPALFAADSPSFMQDMEWTMTKRSETTIRLDGKPRSQLYRDHFQEFAVILDASTGRPLAQRTIDPSGNLETVLVFKEWNVHPEPFRSDFDRAKWDYETFPHPSENRLLKHRQRK